MRRQPASTADSGQTADLIAQHAALLPLWLNFVDGRRAEQQKIQLAMRTHAAPAGAVVEAPVPVTPPADPTKEPVPAAADPTKEPVPADPNPVAWLMEAPPFDPAADDPFAPPTSVVTPDATDAPPPTASGAGAGMDDNGDSGASGAMFAPADSAAIAAGMDEGSESSTGRAEWLRHFEGDFGGDVSQELVAAMEAVDPSALPYDLQQTLEFGQSPEEIAAAFVRAERAGQLDPRLDAAIERMSEVDPLFADARRRADSPTTEDDDEPLF